MTRILTLNEKMGALVQAAQAQGVLDPARPVDVALFSLYARTCDPAVEYLKMTGRYSDRQIGEYLVRVAFDRLTGSR